MAEMSIRRRPFDLLMEVDTGRSAIVDFGPCDSTIYGDCASNQISEKPMKFACLVYHEQKEAVSEAELDLPAIVAECQDAAAWNAEMRDSGHHVYTAGLQSVRTGKTVRNRNGRLCITDGPFAETREALGGLTIIEAKDLNEALELVAKFPARLTSVEVRPIMEPGAELTDPGDRMVAAAIQRASQPRV
jgi:hypothetical protein